ncbi:MAG: TlpA family protein disulfide reductase [Runella sp.]|nr:MAG: TlpA family protein disulfide reductase [Runella sp.]
MYQTFNFLQTLFMKQRFAIFLLLLLAKIAQANAQSTFKVHFTYEKCAKEKAFSFWFHDGEKRIPAHVSKLKNEYIITGKLKIKYTYLQIEQRADNDFRSFDRFIVNQVPAKIHYVKCDTNNSFSYWKDVKIENAELFIYPPSLYRFCVEELKADGEIRRQLLNNTSSEAEVTKLMKDLHAATQKLFDKQLDFLSTHSDSVSYLFLLRDLVENQDGIESDKCEEVFRAFPSEIQNSPEGKLLLKTIQTKRTRAINKPEVGKIAPTFETKDIKGNLVKLKNLNGKYVLLVFWATWCAPCVKEIPQIMDIRKKYAPEKLEVISISLDKDHQKHRVFVNKKKMDWTQIVGAKTLTQNYFIDSLPETVLIDPAGKIVYIGMGYDETVLQKTLASLL